MRVKYPSEYQRKPDVQMRKQVEWHLNKLYQEVSVRHSEVFMIRIVYEHLEEVL